MTLGYHAYMQSPEWLTMREKAFATLGRRCNRCGTTERLQVHHKSYSRVGNEKLSDLEVLCQRCHKGHHDLKAAIAERDPSGFTIKRLPDDWRLRKHTFKNKAGP